MLFIDKNIVSLGATNRVLFLDPQTLKEIKDLRIVWPSERKSIEMCLMKGKTEAECQNHIRVLGKIKDDKLLVCGTHAYKPKCRHYVFKNGVYENIKEMDGIGITPFDPYHNSSFIITDGELYTATVSDFSGADPLIYKEPLRTVQYDSLHLNAPNFVSTLADENYVYFFFREQAVEIINCGKDVFSRVARVCKNDEGGPNKYSSTWRTFLKTRLNCSLAGDYPFYFNHLQSTSEIIEGNYGGEAQKLIYATFTTGVNSISGSAVCAFSLTDISESFEGSFKEQETANSNWLPVPRGKEPKPRPGRCNSSETNSSVLQNAISFIKAHSIMDEAVPSFFGDQPLFMNADLESSQIFTALAVDSQIRSSNGERYDVLYIGTTNGKVLKFVNPSNSLTSEKSRFLLEEMTVFQSRTRIEQLFVFTSNNLRKLIVLSERELMSLPLFICSKYISCESCVGLKDPHCSWDVNHKLCLETPQGSHVNSETHYQNISGGIHRNCPQVRRPDASLEIHFKEPTSSSTQKAHSESPLYSTEELSMALGISVLIALLLGFLFGLFVSQSTLCYCDDSSSNPLIPVPYFTEYTGGSQSLKGEEYVSYPPRSLSHFTHGPHTVSEVSQFGGSQKNGERINFERSTDFPTLSKSHLRSPPKIYL